MTFPASCFSRSGTQNIQGKSCHNQTKAQNSTFLPVTSLPYQSLGLTHSLDLIASIDAGIYGTPHRFSAFLNAEIFCHFMMFSGSLHLPIDTGNWKLVRGLLDAWSESEAAVSVRFSDGSVERCPFSVCLFKDCSKCHQEAWTTTVCCVCVLL